MEHVTVDIAISTVKDFIGTKNGSGKFEGESGLTNWLWHCIMNGDGEEHYPGTNGKDEWDNECTGIIYTMFTIDADEADAFSDEVKSGDTSVIWEDSQGFVNRCDFADRTQTLQFIDDHEQGG